MFGALFSFGSSVLAEFSDSIGKREVRDKATSHATFGFLNLLLGVVFLLVIGLYRDNFLFSLASLPTFIPRAILEILQAHLTVLAVVKADRSDFGIIKSITIPFLLIADLILGYTILPLQLVGIGVIVMGIIFLLSKEHFKTKGLWFIIAGAVNAVITLSLYKYNITHFNSVEAEQLFIMSLQLIYFFFLSLLFYKENPFKFIQKPIFMAQTTAAGLSSVLASYAYIFAPAVIVTAVLRAFSILFSIVSGKLYFHEKHVMVKVTSFCLIGIGLYLLV